MTLIAAVDGSSLGNPGPAGWAWVVSDDIWAAGGWDKATNNIAELTALLRLLEDSAEAGFAHEDLLVYADSQYVLNSVTKWMPGWKRRNWKKADGKPVANREILEALDRALVGRDIKFEWVRGHDGHDLNEAADLRARAVSEAYRSGAKVATGPGFTNRIASRTAFRAAEKKRPAAHTTLAATTAASTTPPSSTPPSITPPSASTGNTDSRTASGASGTSTTPIVALSATDARTRWDEVLTSARDEPVTITQPGQPSLLLLDADLAWRALASLDEDGPAEQLAFDL